MTGKANQITAFDFDRLQKLVEEAYHTGLRGCDYLARLQTELERAQAIPPRWWLGDVRWLLSLRAAGAPCSLLLQPGLCLRSDHVLRDRFGRFAREWLSDPKPS
jgi:hypothetical protein